MRAFPIQFISEGIVQKDVGFHLEYLQKGLPQRQYTVISIIGECKWYKKSSPSSCIFPRHERKKKRKKVTEVGDTL